MKKPSTPRKSWDAPRLSKVDGEGRMLFGCSGAKVARVEACGFIHFRLNDDFETWIQLSADCSITQENSNWCRTEVSREFNEIFFDLLTDVTLRRMTYETAYWPFLHLDFENGVHVQCPVNREGFEYEAWGVGDSFGFHAAALGSGRPMVWFPTSWQRRITERKRKEQATD